MLREQNNPISEQISLSNRSVVTSESAGPSNALTVPADHKVVWTKNPGRAGTKKTNNSNYVPGGSKALTVPADHKGVWTNNPRRAGTQNQIIRIMCPGRAKVRHCRKTKSGLTNSSPDASRPGVICRPRLLFATVSHFGSAGTDTSNYLIFCPGHPGILCRSAFVVRWGGQRRGFWGVLGAAAPQPGGSGEREPPREKLNADVMDLPPKKQRATVEASFSWGAPLSSGFVLSGRQDDVH